MPLLDAALAFALTMLGLATIVTMLVGMLQKARQKRRQLLSDILTRFFEKEALPVLKKAATRWRSDLTAPATPDDNEIEATVRRVMAEALADIEEQKIDSLAAHEMGQLLRTSELGQTLHGRLESGEQEILDHLEARWAALRSRMSERFRFDSSTLSTITAIIIAFGLNFDAMHVLETYLNDPDAVAASLEQQGAVESSFQKVAGGTGDQDLAAQNQAVQQQVTLLTNSSFPIGWELYPRCPPTTADSRCTIYLQKSTRSFDVGKLDYGRREELAGILTVAKANPSGFLLWIIGCLATGLLAGLGAPFWYDVVTGMTQAARSLGQGGGARGNGGLGIGSQIGGGQQAPTTTLVLPTAAVAPMAVAPTAVAPTAAAPSVAAPAVASPVAPTPVDSKE